jgi:cell division transport system permease protein
MMTSIKRIIRAGWKDFSRNIGLSVASVFIMMMVIFVVTVLFLLSPVSSNLISSVEKKVDVSVYFKEDVTEDEIMQVSAEINNISEVKEIEYVSKDQALETFIEKHKNDPVIIESLAELGFNPFLDALNIKAWEASQYEGVADFLETGSFKDLIDNVDYYQRKPVIDKVFAITAGINKIGLFFAILFGIIAVLIAFNTVRIAIHNSNEEISTMRLVGASNSFVRGPFIVQGAIVGIIAAVITLIITFALCYGFDSRINSLASEISLYNIFLNNFFLLFLIQLATGVGLGIISSYIAIRKYLKI